MTMYLGSLVGSSVSGFMVENWGFRRTTDVFLVFAVLALVLDLIEMAYRNSSAFKKNEINHNIQK